MSKLAEDVLYCLRELFPFETIVEEEYVRFQGQQLFFDYYLKGMKILIECQGQQHGKFTKHFHGDIAGFRASKKRDNLKIAYCEENDLTLVFFYDTIDVINNELVLDRIMEAQESV